MSDDEKAAVIEFARIRFDRVDDTLAKIIDRLDEHTLQLDRIERLVADLHVQVALRGTTWRG